MHAIQELEVELKAAVQEVDWMARVWNAADRVAGSAGELSYVEPGAEATPEPPAADRSRPTPVGG
jgi:hypothetical protein